MRDIPAAVLRALGLVVDGEVAVVFAGHGGGEQLHRVVVLHTAVIVGLHLAGGIGEGGLRRALVLGRRREAGAHALGFVRPVQLCHQIGLVRFLRVLHLHQMRGMPRRLERVGHHQRDGLAAVENDVVVQRPERRARRCGHVLVEQIHAAHMRAILMGDDLQHAGDRACGRQVEADDGALRNTAADHHAIGQVRHRPFGGIACLAGDFCTSIDARHTSAGGAKAGASIGDRWRQLGIG